MTTPGLMLKLKLQYFVHLMQRVDSLEKILMVPHCKQREYRGVASRAYDTSVVAAPQAFDCSGPPVNVSSVMSLVPVSVTPGVSRSQRVTSRVSTVEPG